MQKSRKVNFKKKPANNLNYLLNFNYDDHHDNHEHSNNSNRDYGPAKPQKLKNKANYELTSSNFSPFQKILAKYNFNIYSVSNETLNSCTAINKLRWEDIFSLDSPECGEKCSICLEDVVLPKITKCGHVYCTVCLDRLLCHEEKKLLTSLQNRIGQCAVLPKKVWLNCPLCFSLFLNEECKRVKFCSQRMTYKVGNKISFSLFERSGNSLGFKAVGNPELKESKVNKITEQEVLSVFESEKENLKNQLSFVKEVGDSEHLFHVQRVLDRLRIEKATILKPMNQSGEKSSVSKETDLHFFYKVSDRMSNVFLHPFNFRCLQKEHGEEGTLKYDEMEYLTDVKILEVTRLSSITNEFRQKYKYLEHLLPSSEVVFVEVDLAGYLSDETKQFFSKEIQRRKEERIKERRFEKRLLRKMKVNGSIREDFQKQLQKIKKATGSYDARTFVDYMHSGTMDEELKEFLRSTYEDDKSEESSESDDLRKDAKIKSFANIVDKNGYFPALVSTTPVSNATVSQTSNGRSGPWGTTVASDKYQVQSENLTKVRRTPTGKKTNRKNRVELFSTSGGRRYR